MTRPVLIFLLCMTGLMQACVHRTSGPSQEIRVAARYLASAVAWDSAGIKSGKILLSAGDTIGAARELINFHREHQQTWVLTTWDSMPAPAVVYTADQLLRDSVYLYNMHAQVPLLPNGGWKWDYTGPTPDDEFGYALNGHKYLQSLVLAHAWSGRSDYILKLDKILADWIGQHPIPALTDSVYQVYDTLVDLDYRDLGEVEWRTLETGHRLGASWPQIYFSLIDEPDFSDETRMLMLARLAQQAEFLRHYHKRGHNWTTMEMNGLALAGLAFSEFRQSEHWSSYAVNTMLHEIESQVYPDGSQVELAAKTQWVALNRFEKLADNYRKAGFELDTRYLAQLERMYDYMIYSRKPSGHQPLNSDADHERLDEHLLKAAQAFDRDDWSYVITSGGDGRLPDQRPSRVFPHAGVGVFRNAWSSQGHWMFFDAGPYGTGHQHRDKLHLSLAAFGQDMLVDAGRYTHEDYFSFNPEVWRGYFRSSHAHNVLLIDGKGQRSHATKQHDPLQPGRDFVIADKYDFIRSRFNDAFDQVEKEVSHCRSVLHIKDHCWLVVDEVESNLPCDVQALWHFTPDAKLSQLPDGSFAASVDSVHLLLFPLDLAAGSARIVQGQTTPTIQGWHSATYGTKEESPTLIFDHKQIRRATLGWLFVPGRGKVNSIAVEWNPQDFHIELRTPSHQISVPFFDQDLGSLSVREVDRK